ncbi:MAG: M20/M25/M40 family metallo-hydrolase [Candidatus Verstraetearchaeota archaeon]|nr:M20/M25/M40 family metallo-hydrolase [Candidatus Verstraetearchaeota archaeon]
MEDGYPERLLTRMLEIYSPSGGEGEISRFLASEMEALGYRVRVDGVGNVEGRLGSGRPKFLLCGHMDTVEGFLEVKRRGKVIFGRGAVDAKSPLAALICAGRRYIEEGGSGEVVTLAVVDEEGKSGGMRHFLSRLCESFDYAIFGEPSGTYGVTVGYKGRIVFTTSVKTSPGHASAPRYFENAIYVGTRLVEVLKGLDDEWEGRKGGDEESDLFCSPTLCVTLIRGGTQDNTVPGFCEVTADVRVPSCKSVESLKQEIINKIEDFKKGERKAEISIEFKDENTPFEEHPESPLVKAFLESIRDVGGREGKLLRKSGTSDVNDFVRITGTHSVVYGPGNSKLDHTPMENVSIEEFYDSIEIIKSVMLRLDSAKAG